MWGTHSSSRPGSTPPRRRALEGQMQKSREKVRERGSRPQRRLKTSSMGCRRARSVPHVCEGSGLGPDLRVAIKQTEWSVSLRGRSPNQSPSQRTIMQTVVESAVFVRRIETRRSSLPM
jgi:hypothetical protein